MRSLAAKAKISLNHYQDIAHARANPSLMVFLNLVHALGVPPVELFESPEPPSDEYRLVSIDELEQIKAGIERLQEIFDRKRRKRIRRP